VSEFFTKTGVKGSRITALFVSIGARISLANRKDGWGGLMAASGAGPGYFDEAAAFA
jgi:hypothetical protein